MAKYATDMLFLIGLALLAAGVLLAFGLPWALIVVGLLLMAVAVLLARARRADS